MHLPASQQAQSEDHGVVGMCGEGLSLVVPQTGHEILLEVIFVLSKESVYTTFMTQKVRRAGVEPAYNAYKTSVVYRTNGGRYHIIQLNNVVINNILLR